MACRTEKRTNKYQLPFAGNVAWPVVRFIAPLWPATRARPNERSKQKEADDIIAKNNKRVSFFSEVVKNRSDKR